MSSLKKGAGRPNDAETLERIANYVDHPTSDELPAHLQARLDLLNLVNPFVNRFGAGERAVGAIKKNVPELSDKKDVMIKRLIRDCMLVFSNSSALAAFSRNKLYDDLCYAMELAKENKDPIEIKEVAMAIMKLTRADRPDVEQTALVTPVIVMAPMASANVQDYMPTELDAITVEFEEMQTKLLKQNGE